MVAMLFASSSKVYGQGWVPGGELSRSLVSPPGYRPVLLPNGEIWNYFVDLLDGNKLQPHTDTRKLKWDSSDRILNLAPLEVMTKTQDVIWSTTKTYDDAAVSPDGYVYAYANGRCDVFRLSTGEQVTSFSGSVYTATAGLTSGILITDGSPIIKSVGLDGALTNYIDIGSNCLSAVRLTGGKVVVLSKGNELRLYGPNGELQKSRQLATNTTYYLSTAGPDKIFVHSEFQYLTFSTDLKLTFRYGIKESPRIFGNYGGQNATSDYGFGRPLAKIVRPTRISSDSIIHNYEDSNYANREHTIYTMFTGESTYNFVSDLSRYLYWNNRINLGIYSDQSSPLGRIFGSVSSQHPTSFSITDSWITIVPYGIGDDRLVVNADKNKVFHTTNFYSVLRTFGNSLDPLQDPRSVASDANGGIYIADSGNNRIKYYDDQGKLRKVWGTYGDGPGQFDYPHGVAVGPDGLVYVADTYNHRIQVFTKLGNFVSQFGGFGNVPGKLNTPLSVTVDNENIVYIADCLNDRVAIFVRAGALPPSTSKSVSPAANAAGWNVSNVALTFTATANGSTVKDIRTSVNNAAEVIHNGSTATVNLTTDGIHSVAYYATDTDGHNEVTQYTTVRIDTVKPVTTHVYANGKLTLTASDDRSGISKTYYKLDGAAEVEYSSPVDIPAGNHSVEYRSVDIAGNSETAKLFSSAVGVTSVSIVPASVTGGTAATGTITLDASAPAGGVQVSVTSASGAIGLPSSVAVAAGQTASTFTITTNAVATDTDASITAGLNGVTATGVLKVTKAALSSFAINPTSVAGGDSSQMTITLSGPAPSGGTSVALSSGNAKATVPASVVVPAGQSNVTANVLTSAVTTDTTVTLTASLSGTSKTATLQLLSPRAVPSQVTLSPSTVLGGTASTGKVKLAAAAPTGGVVVALQVGGAGATAPATVSVLAGATEATFSVSTQAVTAQKDVTITATASNVSASGTLTIRPIVPTVLDVTPNSGTGGFTATAKLTISDPAPTGGLVIPVTSNNAAVKVPSAVSIAAGKTSVSFSVTTSKVTSDQTATVSASLNGSAVSATVTAKLAAPADITFAPASVGGGSTTTGTLLLTSPASAGGLVVSLTSGNVAVKVPASVTVAAGANSATFVATTSPVGQETSVTIVATAAGVSEFGVLLVTPAKPSSIAFLPGSVLGGKPSTATLTLSGVAPVGGLTVQLRSLTPSVVSVPATVVVPAGKNVVTFVAGSTSVLQSAVVTVEATANGYTASGTLTVRPVIVSKVVLTPPTVVGGIASKGAVTLSDPAPTGGVMVTVTSSDPSVTVSPASQVVALGKTAAAFTASTVAVGTAKSVTITVTANGVPVSTTLVVTPTAVASVTIAPATVISGSGATGTVKLAKAAAVDTTVSLSVDAPAVASVPASVVVLKGSLTATFAIGTTKQTVQKIVIVSATTGGKPVAGKLTVKP